MTMPDRINVIQIRVSINAHINVKINDRYNKLCPSSLLYLFRTQFDDEEFRKGRCENASTHSCQRTNRRKKKEEETNL